MITISQVKELRKKTGAGMMTCKEALESCDGDIKQAIIFLRKKGLKDIDKRSSRTVMEGKIGHYVHIGGQIAVIVEVNCETDFCSRSKDFQQFAKDIAMHIAAASPKWITRDDVPKEKIDEEKDVILAKLQDKPKNIVDKIIDGKLNKFFKENCLLEQLFIKDQDITISDLMGQLSNKVGEKIIIKRFTRYSLGEKEDD